MPSDFRSLADLVQTAITDSPYLRTRNLRFEADRGRVVLRGRVNSFFHKQMAQETVLRLDEVREVENLLEVSG